MRHEIIRTADEWRELRREWEDCLAASRSNTVFMTWEWLDTWLHVRDKHPPLLVVCVRGADGKLVGLAPYYKASYRFGGVIPYRVLRVIGAVDSGAEYQSWIACSAHEGAVCDEIARALRSVEAEWDLIWMPKLPGWSAFHGPMIDALRTLGFSINRRPQIFSSISLPARFEDFLNRMSPNRRQQVRRVTKKIVSRPKVVIRKVSTQAELAPALHALFDLHCKRWLEVGELGVFARCPKEKTFYEQFVPKALAKGWLAMYTLFDDGEPKATQIGYLYNQAFLQLQEGFDPHYEPHVGNALRAVVIEECIRNGVREYDFLGGHSEHKRRWLADKRFGLDVLVGATHLKALPIMKAKVWPTGAYLRPEAA